MGDSITAGYGIDEDKAFPALIRQRVEESGMPVEIVNAGSSGETSTGGLGRINWLLRNSIDVLVLELGGNDALRGISLDLTEDNLAGIVQRTLDTYPDCRIVIAGMQVPPNLGHEYTERFREIFPEIADRFDATLIPFILQDVGGVNDRMQSDGIHPNVEGHAVIAETVWTYLEPVLRDALEERS
jgi:acyl-CoA thioesterase-1